MDLKDFKKSRLTLYVENNNKEKLEDMYHSCFGEYPIEGLTTEDLQYNIYEYLITCDSEKISKIYKDILK